MTNATLPVETRVVPCIYADNAPCLYKTRSSMTLARVLFRVPTGFRVPAACRLRPEQPRFPHNPGT